MPAKAAPIKKKDKIIAAASSGGGKAKKKKWSKGKVRDKLNNMVLFDKATYDKCVKDMPQYKLITPAIVCERFKVRGSLARLIIRELVQRGLIRPVVKHSRQEIYTRSSKEDAPGEQEAGKEGATEKKEGGKKGAGSKKPSKAEAAAAAAAAAAEEAPAE